MRFRAIRAGVAIVAVAAMTALGGGEALARAKVGVLTCNVAPGIGLIVGSSKSLSCSFNPSAPGPNERYSGRISRVGVDVGITGSGVIVWGVFAPSPVTTLTARWPVTTAEPRRRRRWWRVSAPTCSSAVAGGPSRCSHSASPARSAPTLPLASPGSPFTRAS